MPRGSRRAPPLPAADVGLQDWHIRHRFPTFVHRRRASAEGKRVGAAEWQGTLQPRECSPVYTVCVRYRPGRPPTVRVLRPVLARKAPHVYDDGTLCLYWPKEWRWRSSELLAGTIIPWTALWLYYYELWLDTGDWLGSSSHTASPINRDREREADGA